MKAFQTILGVATGLIIAGGAVVTWHFWKMDGVVAFAIGCMGIALATASLGFDMSGW